MSLKQVFTDCGSNISWSEQADLELFCLYIMLFLSKTFFIRLSIYEIMSHFPHGTVGWSAVCDCGIS